jgi:ABC-2 type transport system ATP-binding protein
MRIKVALAAALAYRPRLLILDEPFAGLDVLVRDEFMGSLLQQAGELTVLVTSHEFAEIEGVTTHVGFIREGRILIEESMVDLASRMREVRVTLEQPARIPAPWPGEWLEARAFGNVLTFIDMRHSPETFGERVRSVLGPVRQIDAVPMSLRAQFGVIERAARAGVTP